MHRVIGGAERERLAAAGIDIHVGSCARSVASLAREFNALPSASSLGAMMPRFPPTLLPEALGALDTRRRALPASREGHDGLTRH
jgi:hypothetical protein